MDYKEKYEKAYKLLEQIHNGGVVSKTDIENIFPELKTKSVIDMLKIAIKNTAWLDCDKNKCLSWLEKQGEKQDYNLYKVTVESIFAMVEKYADGDLKDFYDNIKVKCKDAMEYDKTWNEKQGEQKPISKFKVGDKVLLKYDKSVVRTITKVSDSGKSYWIECPGCGCGWWSEQELESYVNQDEQKPADKVEPKFKIGDWVVFNNDHKSVYQVEKIENYEYTLKHILGGSMPLSFSHGDMIRAWTIQDAKDGDVLKEDSCIFIIEKMNPNGTAIVHCCLFDDGEFDLTGSTLGFEVDSTKPATKEQRDLLFSKMKEEGYEWDADKKELNKIEQKSTNSYCQENCKGFQETGKCFADGECKAKREAEQKPAWSEEDELMLKDVLEFIENGWSDKGKSNLVYWLKSLKSRVQPHWKPTDEQMNLLSEVQQALLGKDCHNRFVNFMYDLKNFELWK